MDLHIQTTKAEIHYDLASLGNRLALERLHRRLMSDDLQEAHPGYFNLLASRIQHAQKHKLQIQYYLLFMQERSQKAPNREHLRKHLDEFRATISCYSPFLGCYYFCEGYYYLEDKKESTKSTAFFKKALEQDFEQPTLSYTLERRIFKKEFPKEDLHSQEFKFRYRGFAESEEGKQLAADLQEINALHNLANKYKDPRSLHGLATYYETQTTLQNKEAPLRLYQEAAARGHFPAQEKLLLLLIQETYPLHAHFSMLQNKYLEGIIRGDVALNILVVTYLRRLLDKIKENKDKTLRSTALPKQSLTQWLEFTKNSKSPQVKTLHEDLKDYL
tara:strand:+ start:113931 stop:114923 length:993 start_codon:yes stop_codon:yes gene_type:complete